MNKQVVKISVLFVSCNLTMIELFAQRGVPVPVPQNGGRLFPDWLMFLIFGIIGLVIVVNIFGWLLSSFTNFKAFLDLLAILITVTGTWLCWKITGWSFWWCLLVGFALAALTISVVEWVRKTLYKK